MGHVQTSRLIPADRQRVYAHITDLSHLAEWISPDLEVEFPHGGPIPVPQLRGEFALELRRFGVSAHVVCRVEEMKAAKRFAYRQISGFFRSWAHVQILEEHDGRITLLTDLVDFQLPGGLLGALFDDLFVRAEIARILEERLRKIELHFAQGE